MKIYKEDYKHFRTCKKLAWFLNEKHYDLAKKLIDEKKIINFVELTNTKSSSKINEKITSVNEFIKDFDQENDEEEQLQDYAGETIADGIETGKYAQEYFQRKYRCFNFETSNIINSNLLLNSNEYDVFFEPRFEYDGCVTKCDILKRNGDAWDLIEVKAVTWAKKEHMIDLLYQYDILTKCGFKIANIYIMHLNNQYLLKDKLDLDELFFAYDNFWKSSAGANKSFNLYESVKQELIDNNLSKQYQSIRKILNYNTEEEAFSLLKEKYCDEEQKNYCYHIFPYFDPFNTIFQLYRMRKTKKALWFYEHDLFSLKDERLLSFVLENKLHLRQYDVANNGEKPVDLNALNQLKTELKKYHYPVYMYDFETMKSAVPKFKNTRSYQQIPFQYSVHILLSPDFDFVSNKDIAHYQFLADGEGDPRELLAKNLAIDLTKRYPIGTYVAYNKSFEKSVLKSLIFNFKQYKDELTVIFNKTIDLQDFFKDFKIYKSDFAGSLSIKKTLPAFDASFSYQDLKIKKGDMASEAFRRRVENNISLSLWNKSFRDNMLDYCTRDTLGMVVLFWHVKKLIENYN